MLSKISLQHILLVLWEPEYHPVYYIISLSSILVTNMWLCNVWFDVYFSLLASFYSLCHVHITPIDLEIIMLIHLEQFSWCIFHGVHNDSEFHCPHNQSEHIYFVWTLWWLAVFSAMYTSFLIVYLSFMSKLNESDVEAKLNATLLLPIVAITVVSSSGHSIELDLPHVHQTVLTMIVSFMLWSLSISMAFMVMTLYMWRLIIHKIPPTNLIMTSFLPWVSWVNHLIAFIFSKQFKQVYPRRITLRQNFIVSFRICFGVLLSFDISCVLLPLLQSYLK